MTAVSDKPVSATNVVTGVTTVEFDGAFKTRSATAPPVLVSTVPVVYVVPPIVWPAVIEVITSLSVADTAELGVIVAAPVELVTANSSPSSWTPSPSLSINANAFDKGPLIALIF